jgi:hypothetical protein
LWARGGLISGRLIIPRANRGGRGREVVSLLISIRRS